MPAPHVVVIGGGLAGLAAAIALSEEGTRVTLLEKRPRLGGRATSYVLPTGEHIDNCQHVTLRCCTNLEDFFRRIGVLGQITYHESLVFGDSKGRRSRMKASWLPAPFHMTSAFARFPFLTMADKRAVVRAMLRIIRAGGHPLLRPEMTMLEWLKQTRQTQSAIDRFWRVVLVSALNEQLEGTDAAHGIAVFWKAFLINNRGYEVGLPSVPLDSLYESAAERVRSRGGEVRSRCGVAEICPAEATVHGVRLDDGTVLSADYFVVAVPFDRVGRILPGLFPEAGNLTVSPITSVHFWVDRPVMVEPFVASVDQTIQWVFNKAGGHYLQVVISASRDLKDKSQQEIIDLCWHQVSELIPAAGSATFNRAVVIRENAATFSPAPGTDRYRPGPRTSIRNVFLAGDWTQTGWPATMEGAVRSGYVAADEILKDLGRDVRFLQPELRPSGLMRWLA